MWVTKQLMDPSVFHCIFFSYGSQWGPATVWIATFFKILILENIRRKLIQVWNNIRVRK